MEQFLGNDDLLHCFAENITSLKLLHALCRTNKLFHACFTPYLYRKLTVEVIARQDAIGKIKYESDMDQNPNLKHTKSLSLVATHLVPALSRNKDEFNELLNRIPGLENMELGPEGSIEMLALVIARYPRLKSLSWSISRSLGAGILFKSHAPRISIKADGLTQLTRLYLGNLGVAPELPQADVAGILRSNPHLRELHLAHEVVPEVPNHHTFSNYLYDLCELYHAQGGSPLRLRHLHLGYGMRLYGERDRAFYLEMVKGRPDSNLLEMTVAPADYLNKLCAVSNLEEVGFWHACQSFKCPDINSLGRVKWIQRPIAWSTFTKERAPRLRRVWVSRFHDGVYSWIENCVTTPDGYGNQVVIGSGTYRNAHPMKLDVLPLPWKPRELDLNLELDARRATGSGEESTALPLILSCSSYLEGLGLVPPVYLNEKTCGSYTWLLSQLPQLRAFRLRRCSLQLPQGHGFVKPNLPLLDRLVRHSHRSLRYIKIDIYAWRIVRDPSSGRPVKLEGMDAWEQVEVDLFREHPFSTRHNTLYNCFDGDDMKMTGTLYWKDIHDFDLPDVVSPDVDSVASLSHDLLNLRYQDI